MAENEVQAMQLWAITLCSPNEDFGIPSKHSGTYFQSTFQMNVAQIEYSPFQKCFENAFPNVYRPSKIFVWGLNGEHKAYTLQTKILEG